MTESKYKFTIPTSNQGQLSIPIEDGSAVFILGANGTGKSTLMQYLSHQNIENSIRILAQRQTWFSNSHMYWTPDEKRRKDIDIANNNNNPESRFLDSYSNERTAISIFNLINSQNTRYRNIGSAYDEGNRELANELSKRQNPLKVLNELLNSSNIPITIHTVNDDRLFASKKGGEPYNIIRLSDGERNALLICADVLTAKPNTLIIIDEPERHLHRSIISPLLTNLFQQRNDCAFVISTHDISLPLDHPNPKVLLARGCLWNGSNISNWDVDLIQNYEEIPVEVKQDILGSKRDILFVEGNERSLDKQIYQLIYPNVSVVAQGNCSQVEKAIEGIGKTNKLHWINAVGLIDADDRTEEEIQRLYEKGIVSLECYSVESLYYNLEIIKQVAKKYSGTLGENENLLYEKAISEIVSNMEKHKKELCSRLCEKKVKDSVLKNLPRHKDIALKDKHEIIVSLKDFLKKEEVIFENLISTNNINGLISRYPVRETSVLDGVAKGLGIKRDVYEKIVRKLIIDDIETRDFFRNKLLSKLTKLIEKEPQNA